ncbi:MAG: biotin/lipoyl-binding protein [Granulosicoccus sp.]|nr:biotin/lipoyl-binding protein [Granulosicoccus sp.]
MTDVNPEQLNYALPRVSPDCIVQYCTVRSKPWVVLNNRLSGRYIRLPEDLWFCILKFDGNISLQDWLVRYQEQFEKKVLLESLYALQRLKLLSGLPELNSSFEKKPGFNPLFFRIPLFNPSQLLNRVACATSKVGWVATVLFVLALFAVALLITIVNAYSLREQLVEQLISPSLWQFALIYPVMKLLHELSHAVVLRRAGQIVPEAGLSMMVLMPLPYVDVSRVWSLGSRGHRIAVTIAGSVSDLSLASIGIMIWHLSDPGVFSELGLTMTILGLATVILFNANPLLKFDGYYLLEDSLDCPGLYRRSGEYCRYICKRYILRIKDVTIPAVEKTERFWLLVYGVCSIIYRYFIVLVITIYLINQLRLLGLFLSLFALVPLFLKPIVTYVKYLFCSPELDSRRLGVMTKSLAVLSCLICILCLVPLSSSTRTQGIVWVPEQAQLYADESGSLTEILATSGQSVSEGQAIFRLSSPELEIQLQRKQSELALARLDKASIYQASKPGYTSSSVQIEQLQREFDEIQVRLDHLLVRSPATGRIAYDHSRIAKGLYIEKGEVLAHLVDTRSLIVKAVVAQSAMSRLSSGIERIHVRLAQNMFEAQEAIVNFHVPSGNNSLPSAALKGHGFWQSTPNEDEFGAISEQRVFHLELGLDNESPGGPSVITIGTRAFVTLTHTPETLIGRWWRGSRQILIRSLRV